MSEVVNLEELCTGIIDCPHSTPKWQDRGIPVIRNYNLKDGKIDCTNLSFVSEEGYKERVKRAIPEESDIIISREAPMGVVGIVPKGFQCCLGQRLVLLKIDKSKCLPKYLLYTLMSEYVQLQIRRINQTGSIVSNLNISSLKELKIPLHSFEEQKKIANILSAIDDKIQINNQINQELEAMGKSLYDYWFVQFDFPDQNGKPYKSSGGKMVYNPELKREIPEGWGVESVGNLLDKVTKAEKIENNSIEFVGRIPVIDQSQKYIAGFTNNQNSLIQPQNGHVIFGDHTRVVKYINFDYARGADGTQVLISNNENISNVLLYHMIEDFDLSNYGYARHFKFLKEKLVIVPDKKISLQFANKADVIYKKIRNNIFENQELTQLRDWLLPMLMNGQVKVE